LSKLRALEERLKRTQLRRERAQARSRGEKTARPATERAADLVAGGRVPGASPESELAACDHEEFEILLPAIRAQTAVLDDIRQTLSLAANERLKPAHDAALCALLRALEDSWTAVTASAEIVNRLRALGYLVRYDILPAQYPPVLSLWATRTILAS